MLNNVLLGDVLDSLVPISRFNKGEANKIFDEVRLTGYKIVVKNNAPACVLLSPEKYKELTDILDDHYLLALAEERMRNDNAPTIPFEKILAKDGLTIADLEVMDDVCPSRFPGQKKTQKTE